VLVHEFAHAVRRDPLVGFVQRLAAIVYWPYPPVHFLNRRLAVAREEVCDNYVLREGDAPSYAETLLAISQRFFSKPARPAALGLFHPYRRLERRVAELLDPRRNVMVRTHRVASAILAAMFATAVIVVACTRLLHAEPPALPAPPVDPIKQTSDTVKLNIIQRLDVLQIRVMGTLPDQPIDGYYLVEPSGQIALGPAYGRVDVSGMTCEQAESNIVQYLKKIVTNPAIQVALAKRKWPWREAVLPKMPYKIGIFDILQVRVLGTLVDQPIDSYFLVESTGTLALGPAYGRVQVKGLTLDEAESAIQKKLEEVLLKPEVQVTFAGWQSENDSLLNGRAARDGRYHEGPPARSRNEKPPRITTPR